MTMERFFLRTSLAAVTCVLPGCGHLEVVESCPDSNQDRPTALNIYKPGYGGMAMGARALDINSSGTVVGLEEGDYREGRPPYGFAFTSGKSGFTELIHEGRAILPQALNDSGWVAGFSPRGNLESAVNSWPVLGSWPYSGPRPEPIEAVMMRIDGEGYRNLHPEGLEFSKAKAISPGGLVGGMYSPGDADSMHACLFNYPGVGLVDLHIPGVARSEVIDLNDSWILVHGFPSTEGVAYLIRIGEPWTRLKAPGPPEVRLAGISAENRVVGYHHRSAGNLQGKGIVFSANDLAITPLPDSLRLGNFLYDDIRPKGTNRNGMVVGIAYRIIPGRDIFPQARAFSWDEGTGIFRDISPSNAYAEAYGINDDGMVAGYSGFTDERCGVYNRAILTESTAGPQLVKWE